jgi:TPR repeat protein
MISPSLRIGWAIGELEATLVREQNSDTVLPLEIFQNALDSGVLGDKDGLYLLGAMFEFGAAFWHKIGTNEVLVIYENKVTASALFSLAEEKGHASASFRLGMLVHHGILGPTDLELATKHFVRGAINGHPTCFRMVGIFYQLGKDYGSAREWFLRGAELGDPVSAFNTAKAIQRGELSAYSTEDAVRFARDAKSKMPDDEEFDIFFRELSDGILS